MVWPFWSIVYYYSFLTGSRKYQRLVTHAQLFAFEFEDTLKTQLLCGLRPLVLVSARPTRSTERPLKGIDRF